MEKFLFINFDVKASPDTVRYYIEIFDTQKGDVYFNNISEMNRYSEKRYLLINKEGVFTEEQIRKIVEYNLNNEMKSRAINTGLNSSYKDKFAAVMNEMENQRTRALKKEARKSKAKEIFIETPVKSVKSLVNPKYHLENYFGCGERNNVALFVGMANPINTVSTVVLLPAFMFNELFCGLP